MAALAMDVTQDPEAQDVTFRIFEESTGWQKCSAAELWDAVQTTARSLFSAHMDAERWEAAKARAWQEKAAWENDHAGAVIRNAQDLVRLTRESKRVNDTWREASAECEKYEHIRRTARARLSLLVNDSTLWHTWKVDVAEGTLEIKRQGDPSVSVMYIPKEAQGHGD